METQSVNTVQIVQTVQNAKVPPTFSENILRQVRSALPSSRLAFALHSLLLACCLCVSAAHADGVQVLHWWKSASERKAIDVLAVKLVDEGVVWRDGVIPGGAGVGAHIVLRSRILAGDAPAVAQLNGVVISEWDRLGLLLNFDATAVAGKWDKVLLPGVLNIVRPNGHFVAAPLGIHRINTLFYNRKLFAQYDLKPPQNWTEFEQVALKLHKAGIAPLAQSSEPWQIATLFETLMLAEGGASFFRNFSSNNNPLIFSDSRIAKSLERLRGMKKYMLQPIQERNWTEVTRQFADGAAAMMVMGDWAKGELNAWGLPTDEIFSCIAVPQTAHFHLYDIDTLVMLATEKAHRSGQEKLAKIAMLPQVQSDYNLIKGSVSVLRQPDMAKMDSCSRASWQLFASGPQAQVPSLVHRMAADEVSKDAILAVVHRFFLDESMTVAQAQRRLGVIARTQTKSK